MKKMRFFPFILTLLLSTHTFCQEVIRDEVSVINFDNGVGFQAPDKRFGVNLRFRMQNRAGISGFTKSNLRQGQLDAYVRRMRLRFDGYLLQEKFTYTIQFSFTRNDIEFENVQYPQIIRDAMIYYHLNKKVYFGFGQGKLPGNRQRVISSGNLQFVDRSDANSLFTLDRDYGLFGYAKQPFLGSMFILKAALSTGEGRINRAGDTKISTTVRAEWLPFGEFTKNGDYSEGDLAREPSPKLSIGGGLSKNNGTIRTAGQLGPEIKEPSTLRAAFGDMIVKYRGFATELEYIQRNVDDPTVTTLQDKAVFIYKGHGFNSQLSYLFKNNLEVAGRYTAIRPHEDIRHLTSPYNVYVLGLTKYLMKHQAKLQLNLQYKEQPATSYVSNKNQYSVIFQFEFGI